MKKISNKLLFSQKSGVSAVCRLTVACLMIGMGGLARAGAPASPTCGAGQMPFDFSFTSSVTTTPALTSTAWQMGVDSQSRLVTLSDGSVIKITFSFNHTLSYYPKDPSTNITYAETYPAFGVSEGSAGANFVYVNFKPTTVPTELVSHVVSYSRPIAQSNIDATNINAYIGAPQTFTDKVQGVGAANVALWGAGYQTTVGSDTVIGTTKSNPKVTSPGNVTFQWGNTLVAQNTLIYTAAQTVASSTDQYVGFNHYQGCVPYLTVTLNKVWDTGSNSSSSTTLSLSGSTYQSLSTNVPTATSTPSTAGSAKVSAKPGDSISLSETALSTYDATWTCTKETDGTIVNQGTGSLGTLIMPTDSNVTCTIKNTPKPTTNLSITKDDGQTTVSSNGTVNYVIRVSNAGPSTVTDAVLKDPTVTGLNVTGVTCTATASNTCTTAPTAAALASGYTLPSLVSGDFYEIKVTGTVTATSGTITNTATVTSAVNRTDGTTNNQSATDTDSVTPVGFGTCPTEAFIGRGTSSTTIGLYVFDLGAGTMAQQGTNTFPTDTNGLGFRQADGLVYGWTNGVTPQRLVQIGQNGATTIPFATPPSGLPSGANFYVADIQPSTGYYVGVYSNTLYFIDVTTNTLIKSVVLTNASLGNDMAFNPADGMIYSVSNSGQLNRVDPTTGATTLLSIVQQNADGTLGSATLPTNDPAAGGFGAVFFDAKGTMYAYKSGSGGTYGALYTIFNPTTATPSWVRGVDTPTASNLDGARCPSAPPPYAPLKVTKNVTGATSASDMTFNFTVTCTAPSGSYTGTVTVPANNATSSVNLTNTIPLNSAGCKITENTPLPTAPSGYTWGTPTYNQPTGFITGTSSIVVITNPLTPNATPGALSITKTATPYIKVTPDTATGNVVSLTPASITYTITVSNIGGTALGPVSITDALPTGLSYDAGSAKVIYSDASGAYPVANAAAITNIGTATDLSFALSGLNVVDAGKSAQITFSATPAIAPAATPAIANNTNATAINNNAKATSGSALASTLTPAVTNIIYPKLSKTVRNVSQNGAAGTTGTGLPGDVLEYCLNYNNYSSVPLSVYTITDNVPPNTTAKTNGYGTGNGIQLTRGSASPVTYTAATGDDAGSLTTSGGLGSGTATISLGSVPAGESGSACFQSIIK